MQLSICDVTLWGLKRTNPDGVSSDALIRIVSAIDSLNVDSILIPDELLIEPETAASLCSAVTSAEIIFAVTDPGSLIERIANTQRSEYSIRFMNLDDSSATADFNSLRTSSCLRVECEVDINSALASETLISSEKQGIDRLILTDRSGSLLPHQTEQILKQIVPRQSDKRQLGCRFRHDMGVSMANSLIAATQGIQSLDCSILGVGPYAGYTPLEEVATTLRIHSEQYSCTTKIKTENLLPVNQLVSEQLGLSICPNKPVSGENIFATEAGIHQDGLLKNPDTYLPYRPELVGASGIQLVIGRHSGKRAVAHRLEELGHSPQDEQVLHILDLIKKLPKGEKVTDDKLSQLFTQS
ncbi:2-isopropylmalate synthase [Polystyrenella longa]|uniref:2-isopropylmalate synthase n=1 Tax=Polystyrenella longa TaxID=2528007 RepID=A0A518CMF4_9PLAN|nr:hypothetical protein [Polystyrenella longa]QDU80364.1 2-isopropylmalate synthase [Polystyrenella longa]